MKTSKQHSLSRLAIFSLSVLFLLSGCSGNKVFAPNGKSVHSKNTSPKVRALKLSSLESLEAIVPQLASHKAVLVGEVHTRYADHLNQLSVIKGLHQKWKSAGTKTAIGLEMIQHPFQKHLDNYIAGEITEKEMLRRTEWFDRWRYDFRLYRPIFEYARNNKIPLVALNVPKEITKRITKVGIKGLNAKERSQLPKTLDISNPAYQKRLKSVFSGHSRTSSKGFDKFLEAQLAWDEGMASRAAGFLQNNSGHRIVILAGGGHLINREGIPDRLERRIKSKPAVVLNNIIDVPNPQNGDYLLFSPETKLPPSGKIGIVMKDTDKGVVIESVSHHSAAAKAKLKKGDLIQQLGNSFIKNTTDIRLWALDKKPGNNTTVVIKRKNKIKTQKITLGGASSRGGHSMKSMMIHGK